MTPFDLSGRVALVTGAGHGIGRAIAIGPARAGAGVVLHARRADDLDEVASAVLHEGRAAERWVRDLDGGWMARCRGPVPG
ncbi:SDR family NAD(P)-dependent oxidoreductase [Dactylosporangium matsuzakiense]|uniref:Short subunit dehydrogenase n=1 Tax=Dactylosporangium matsuzakiense TaxID=53360 RepID=A0A9W6KRP5_9ACTN|nr:SDR family NAD(P)-dependent oxidoreductase [Dactylosporangium matsuzakiense]UWZ47418.1 SDR family NAD(P)-dependent oxidoreductase [Dactylosporangium matsuzakiense]GLL05165.1 hypothetical protein GCM10017581_069120 [Dactylosporangium matsuzakiense]